jgi:hypothetical protein
MAKVLYETAFFVAKHSPKATVRESGNIRTDEPNIMPLPSKELLVKMV